MTGVQTCALPIYDISLALAYSAADVFVAPSVQENLANTVVEALSCATPCVAFNIGGMPDMITHKENGYLAKPFETDDLAEGIKWIIENDKGYQYLSTNARMKAVNSYSIDRIANMYEQKYNDIIRTHKN